MQKCLSYWYKWFSFFIFLTSKPEPHVCAKLLQSFLTLCDPMDCSPPNSSTYVSMKFSRQEYLCVWTTCEFVRNADSQAPLKLCWIRICILITSLSDSPHSHLRSTDLSKEFSKTQSSDTFTPLYLELEILASGSILNFWFPLSVKMASGTGICVFTSGIQKFRQDWDPLSMISPVIQVENAWHQRAYILFINDVKTT